MSQPPAVQMFWHGAPLSRVERLSMVSFLANGHPVQLYVYDEPAGVPAGVQLKDASRILSRDLLFHHRRSGSVALFADWFRYRLLLEHGGLWVDTDIVCLKPLVFARPEVFGWQDGKYINNAVLGLPRGHELAAWMVRCCENPNQPLPYDRIGVRLRKLKRSVLYGNRRERTGWGEFGPKGLTEAARYLGYAERALPPSCFYPVRCDDWQRLFQGGGQLLGSLAADCHAVHLWNNMLRTLPGFDKNARFPEDSPFEQLWRRYL